MNTLIIAGGTIISKSVAKNLMSSKSYDLIIAVDKGFNHAQKLGISPSCIVGDFDSIDTFDENIDTFKSPVIKDDTDLKLAVNLAIKKKSKNIDIICATGGRLDHELANFSILQYLYTLDIHARIIDNQNIIQVISGENSFDNISKYISILPITDTITVSSLNLSYPLDNTVILRTNPYSISNECTSSTFSINIHQGIAFLFFSND